MGAGVLMKTEKSQHSWKIRQTGTCCVVPLLRQPCKRVLFHQEKDLHTAYKGLKPGRKYSHEGRGVHREEATLRGKPIPIFSSPARTLGQGNFSTGCRSQPHNHCAWACPYLKTSTIATSFKVSRAIHWKV